MAQLLLLFCKSRHRHRRGDPSGDRSPYLASHPVPPSAGQLWLDRGRVFSSSCQGISSGRQTLFADRAAYEFQQVNFLIALRTRLLVFSQALPDILLSTGVDRHYCETGTKIQVGLPLLAVCHHTAPKYSRVSLLIVSFSSLKFADTMVSVNDIITCCSLLGSTCLEAARRLADIAGVARVLTEELAVVTTKARSAR